MINRISKQKKTKHIHDKQNEIYFPDDKLLCFPYLPLGTAHTVTHIHLLMVLCQGFRLYTLSAEATIYHSFVHCLQNEATQTTLPQRLATQCYASMGCLCCSSPVKFLMPWQTIYSEHSTKEAKTLTWSMLENNTFAVENIIKIRCHDLITSSIHQQVEEKHQILPQVVYDGFDLSSISEYELPHKDG